MHNRIQGYFKLRTLYACRAPFLLFIFWSSVLKITRPLGQTNWKWKWHPELTETEPSPPSFCQQQVGCLVAPEPAFRKWVFGQDPGSPNIPLFLRGGGRGWFFQSLCIIGADTLVSDNSDLCRPGNFAGLISFSLGLKRGWQIVQEINFGIGSMSCWVRKRSNSHLGNEKAATPTIRALLSSVWTFFGGWALGLCEL